MPKDTFALQVAPSAETRCRTVPAPRSMPSERMDIAALLGRQSSITTEERAKVVRPICDWRRGCGLIADIFPANSDLAQAVISSNPHLAEALVRLGMPYSSETVDMALALQEARHCPTSACTCVCVEPARTPHST
jgi:hypothetical protein